MQDAGIGGNEVRRERHQAARRRQLEDAWAWRLPGRTYGRCSSSWRVSPCPSRCHGLSAGDAARPRPRRPGRKRRHPRRPGLPSSETSGAHTGDISAEMLADAGANAVIVGHSERRDRPWRDRWSRRRQGNGGASGRACRHHLRRRDRDASGGTAQTLDVVGRQLDGSLPQDRRRPRTPSSPMSRSGRSAPGLTPTPATSPRSTASSARARQRLRGRGRRPACASSMAAR